MKRLLILAMALTTVVGLTACSSPPEDNPKIPVGHPGDGGPSPSKVMPAGGGGGGGAAAEAGGTQAAQTQ
ncbi:MAG: hypothetical protein KF857_11710 [Fimbriimonadaceae bacterium]|nr:hypothetical protein [Fimbriimonadaceae bacterium]